MTFKGIYSGCRVVPGLDLADHPTVVLNRGGAMGSIDELLYKFVGCAPRWLAQLKQHAPVLVHAHFGSDGATAMPLARQLDIPLVVTFHGADATLTDAWFRGYRWGRRYLRRRDQLKRRGALFIAVSRFIAERLANQGFPAEKIRVHYIGVDTDTFTPDRLTPRQNVVLFVGRLVEKKGCEYLIRAMQSVQQELPEAELVVIGDGPLRSSLEAQAKQTLRSFSFLGAQPTDVVRGWMKKARLFCTPSIIADTGDAEGFGIVFIESQASGLPVVSFSTGGIPEAVAHGQTGYLAPEKDSKTLAMHIARLLRDDATWKAFSTEGQARVKRLFDLKTQTQQLENLYAECLRSEISTQHDRSAGKATIITRRSESCTPEGFSVPVEGISLGQAESRPDSGVGARI